MTVATALASANEPHPRLAEDAVRQALGRAGLTHANGVLLFLSPEFARHAQQSITAVARAARCTQLAGGIASGVFTESGWALDRPAAAVMVLGGGLGLGHPVPDKNPVLSYAGGGFPAGWTNDGARFGGSFSSNSGRADHVVWQQCRIAEQQRCSAQILGASIDVGFSSGLQLLGKPLAVDSSNGFDVERMGGQAALKSLNRLLPTPLQDFAELQFHHVCAVRVEGARNASSILDTSCLEPISIIAANADNSLTLAERVTPGQLLNWAIRQPISAVAEMRQSIQQLAGKLETDSKPLCALMFSCIGRGPYFYGGEDCDLEVVIDRFPGMPILGAYGTGQIAPATRGGKSVNRQMQNAVVTALVSTKRKDNDVQSIA